MLIDNSEYKFEIGVEVFVGLKTHEFSLAVWHSVPEKHVTHELFGDGVTWQPIIDLNENTTNIILPINGIKSQILEVTKTDWGGLMLKVNIQTVPKSIIGWIPVFLTLPKNLT